MRLYALYNNSKRVLFILVLGFIIEIAANLVGLIQSSIFIGQLLIDIW